MVRVSVVVPTRDHVSFLREALQSIRLLEAPDLQFEILVGDNGSTRETAQVAHAFGGRHLTVNRDGAGAARNAALAAATGDYIAFLDDDDLWTKDHIRPHLKTLRERPELQAVVGQIQSSRPDRTPFGAPWPDSLPEHGDLLLAFLGYQPQLGATVARAEIRESVGAFDEALIGDQDWDWHLRLATKGKIGFVKRPCVLFRHRELGSMDHLQAMRVGYSRRVFLRHARTAWARGARLQLAAAYQRIMGNYVTYFLLSAEQHAAAGRRGAALNSVFMSLRLVPASTLYQLVRSSSSRRAVLTILR